MAAFLFRVSAPTSRKPLVTDAFLLNHAIEALRAYSLVTRNPGAKAFSVPLQGKKDRVSDLLSALPVWAETFSQSVLSSLDLYSVHRLVQVVLVDSMTQESRQQWTERAVLAVNATFPDVEHASWPQCERLLSHALVAAQLIEQEQIRYCQRTGNCRVIASECNVKVGHGPTFCPKKQARKGLK